MVNIHWNHYSAGIYLNNFAQMNTDNIGVFSVYPSVQGDLFSRHIFERLLYYLSSRHPFPWMSLMIPPTIFTSDLTDGMQS
jgi:hypothetical protein